MVNQDSRIAHAIGRVSEELQARLDTERKRAKHEDPSLPLYKLVSQSPASTLVQIPSLRHFMNFGPFREVRSLVAEMVMPNIPLTRSDLDRLAMFYKDVSKRHSSDFPSGKVKEVVKLFRQYVPGPWPHISEGQLHELTRAADARNGVGRWSRELEVAVRHANAFAGEQAR